MSLNRHNPRRDQNEKEIVYALRMAGYVVTRMSAGGVPDLLVVKPSAKAPVYVVHDAMEALDKAHGHPVCLLEVKMPGEKLTEAQRDFFLAVKS